MAKIWGFHPAELVRFHPAQPLRQITAILKWSNKNAEEIFRNGSNPPCRVDYN